MTDTKRLDDLNSEFVEYVRINEDLPDEATMYIAKFLSSLFPNICRECHRVIASTPQEEEYKHEGKRTPTFGTGDCKHLSESHWLHCLKCNPQGCPCGCSEDYLPSESETTKPSLSLPTEDEERQRLREETIKEIGRVFDRIDRLASHQKLPSIEPLDYEADDGEIMSKVNELVKAINHLLGEGERK